MPLASKKGKQTENMGQSAQEELLRQRRPTPTAAATGADALLSQQET